MELTIIVVNWNGGALLIRCLESIRACTDSRRVRVIVVDNDSKDGSREAAMQQFPDFHIMNSGANLGFSRANNLARSLVDTPLVLFLNPDTQLMDGALDRAIECLRQHTDVGALGCKMLQPDGKVQELGLQWSISPLIALIESLVVSEGSRYYLRRLLPVMDAERSGYLRKLYGGCLLVRKEVLDAAGWFDERYFMYAEDADLSRTIRALGWKLYYCAEAVIIHVGGGVTVSAPGTFSYLMKQESINKLIQKYQGRSAAVMHRIAVCIGGVVRLGAVLLGSLMVIPRADAASTARWAASRLKQQQLILWSLGLRKATVPVSRPAA
jgi:GT2 family glycosyltransferase